MKNRLLSVCLLAVLAMFFAAFAQAEGVIPSINITSEDMLRLTDKTQTAKGYFEYAGPDGRGTSGHVTIRIMGSLSTTFPKKNYNIRFYADEACTDAAEVAICGDWGAHTKYTLKANWIDVTQARNIVSSRLYAQAQAKYGLFPNSPNHGQIDGFFVEVYVNGAYHGLYTLNIPKDDWLYGLDKKNDDHIAMITSSSDPQSSAAFAHEAAAENGVEWEIEIGPDDTAEDIAHCFERLNRLIRFVKDSSDEEFVSQFSQYLDLDACLNYYSFLYLSNAVDNKIKNLMLVTFDGEIWYPTMYDLDATWGLYFGGDGLYMPYDRFPENHMTSVLWDRFTRLFAQQIKERHAELRSTVWSQENIAAAFTAFVNSIPQAAYERNLSAWPDQRQLAGSLEQIIDYARLRGEYADSCIDQLWTAPDASLPEGALYQLTGEYKGGMYAFRNTGVNLYPADDPNGKDYTIVLQYSNNAELVAGSGVETVLSHTDAAMNGLIVETVGADYTMFYAGAHQYEALYHQYPEVRSLVIVKQGNDYTFYADDVNNVRYISGSALNSGIDTNLYLGAQSYHTKDGCIVFSHSFTGTLHRFEILDAALSAEEAGVLLQEMTAGLD